VHVYISNGHRDHDVAELAAICYAYTITTTLFEITTNQKLKVSPVPAEFHDWWSCMPTSIDIPIKATSTGATKKTAKAGEHAR
jgi:hypothetical protein